MSMANDTSNPVNIPREPFHGHYGMRIDLPILPVELQLSILIHLPPNQLFPLRRVSRSWNDMLTNTQLLEHINNQLPFLSSAPDFTSRMKRRMRMARGEPVWAKSYSEAFPWAKEFCRQPPTFMSPPVLIPMVKFWHGWVVVMAYYCSNTCVDVGQEKDGTTVLPVIKFRIQTLAQPKNGDDPSPLIEVDVVETLKRMHQEGYDKGLRSVSTPQGFLPSCLHAYHFSVQQGKVVVGVTHRNFTGLRDIYFFIFSIFTGNLIQYIHRIHRTRHDRLYLTRVNATHFLTVYRTLPTSDSISERRIFGNHSGNIYSIQHSAFGINTYSLHDGTRLPEVLITGPNVFKNIRPNYNDSLSVNGVALDHLGRLWFPFVFGATVGTIEYDIGHQMAIGGFVYTSKTLMQDLPKSPCGNWSLVPVVLGLKPSRDFVPVPCAMLESIISKEEATEPCSMYPGRPGHGLRQINVLYSTERGMLTFESTLHEHILYPKKLPGLEDVLPPQLSLGAVRPVQLKTSTGTIRIRSFKGSRCTNIDSTTYRIPVDAEKCLNLPTTAIATRCGYIGVVDILTIISGAPVKEREDAEIFSNILHLLPFHCSQAEREAQRAHVMELVDLTGSLPEISQIHGWKPVKNGLRTEHFGPFEPEENRYFIMYLQLAWVDDGLIGWQVISHYKPVELWMVCYEENWVV